MVSRPRPTVRRCPGGMKSVARRAAGVLFSVAVYGALLFAPARTLDWWRAWVLLAVTFCGMLAARFWVFAENDELLAERRKSPIQRGQPPADKVLVVAFVIVFPAYIAFVPFDVFELHLLGRPGPVVSALGLAAFIAGGIIVALAFRENAFAAAIIKHQADRGQIVVATGPYAIVRHPLYSGVVLLLIGAALWLGSSAAAFASVVPIGLLVARIVVEERFLEARLAGYPEYVRRVSHRLLPGVW